jgi:hypothetical protein
MIIFNKFIRVFYVVIFVLCKPDFGNTNAFEKASKIEQTRRERLASAIWRLNGKIGMINLIKNKESGRHLAQALRIIGVTQFAHYGVSIINKGDFSTLSNDDTLFLILSGIVFIWFEILGSTIIEKVNNKTGVAI